MQLLLTLTPKKLHMLFLYINLILRPLQMILKILHEFIIIAPPLCPTLVLGDFYIDMLISSNKNQILFFETVPKPELNIYKEPDLEPNSQFYI
jgi:hypothetical protein